MSKKDIPILLAVIIVLVGAPLIIFRDKIFKKSDKSLADEKASEEEAAKTNTVEVPKVNTGSTTQPKVAPKTEHVSFYIPKNDNRQIKYYSTPNDSTLALYMAHPVGKTFIPVSFKSGYPIGWVEIEKGKWVKENIGTRGTLIF
jgi:hypothetical protein